MAIGWISAPGNAGAAAGTLTAQDYAEIEQLYWRYAHGGDFRGQRAVAVGVHG